MPPAAFGGRLVRHLVRLLAVHRGETVTRDRLAAALWPRRPPADPGANLNVLVNRARRALAPADIIQTVDDGYVLMADAECRIDIDEFRAAATRAHRLAGTDPHRAVARFEQALQWWGGEPLPDDVYADWSEAIRAELHRTHQQALEGAAAAALDAGLTPQAVLWASDAVAAEPLRESAHLLLVRALAAAGDRAGALDAFERLRTRLSEDLGLDPTPQAEAMLTRILRGADVGSGGDPTWQQLAFVGRHAEITTVHAAVSGPRPHVVLVTGVPGAGKSRLLRELAPRLNVPCLTVRAFRAQKDDAWSLASAVLAEAVLLDTAAVAGLPPAAAAALASLVPDLPAHPGTTRLDAESRRALVLEGGIRLLEAAAGSGTALLIDDLQWADASSLALLARAIERVPALVPVVAYRAEEVASQDPVGDYLTAAAAVATVTSVPVERLGGDAVAALVDDPDLAAVLTGQTDGTPYAIGQVLRLLAEDDYVRPDRTGRWRTVRDGAADSATAAARNGSRKAVEHRLRRLDPPTRVLLSVLALVRRAITARPLAAVAAVDEGTVLRQLDRLFAAGLVRQEAEGWVVAHDIVADAAVAVLEPGRRVALHGAIARALQQVGGSASGIAHHLAGAGDPRAPGAYAEAARDRLGHHAAAEARELAMAGLRLEPSGRELSDLLAARAEAHAHQGNLAGARADLRAAIAAHPHGPGKAELLARTAILASGADDMRHAAELADLAVVEAGASDLARARALSVGAIIDMNIGDRGRARARAAEALGLFQRLGDARGMAEITEANAMATFLAGHVQDAADAFVRAARLLEDVGHLVRALTPLSTAGHALVFVGRPAEALTRIDRTLELAAELGHPETRSYALWHRSEALAALGDPHGAIAAAGEALRIAESLGHRGWTATAWRGLGIGRAAAGDRTGALDAFTASLAHSENLRLFAAWAHARLALAHVEGGDLDAAERHLTQARTHDQPLAGYEVDWAAAELAAAREEPDRVACASRALDAARTGGCLALVPRLQVLAGSAPV